MTTHIRRPTADKVQDILGMPRARQLLSEFDGDGEPARIARETILSSDPEMRRNMALIEIAHAVDAVREDADVARQLKDRCDAIMSGESKTACRHLSDAVSTFDRKIDALKLWIMGSVATCLLSALFLLINLIAKK